MSREVAELAPGFSNFMQRLRCRDTLSSRYAWYCIKSAITRSQLNYWASTTTGLANLNGSLLARLRIAMPSLADQRAIADFLDSETAKIDDLIARKRLLSRLLNEDERATVMAGIEAVRPESETLQLRRVVNRFVDYRGQTPEKTVADLWCYFRSVGLNKLEIRATGSTAIGIKASHLKGVPVVVPPLAVQQKIVAEYATRAAEAGAVGSAIDRALSVLREYRSALITAAVTGQIDITNPVRTEPQRNTEETQNRSKKTVDSFSGRSPGTPGLAPQDRCGTFYRRVRR